MTTSAILELLQLVLHYAGVAAVAVGAVIFVFGNRDHGKSLLIRGLGLLVLNWGITLFFINSYRLWRS